MNTSNSIESTNLRDPLSVIVLSPNNPLSVNGQKKKKKSEKTLKLGKLNDTSTMLDDLVNYLKDFKITAVYSQKSGRVCRIKKSGCRHTHASLNLSSSDSSNAIVDSESSINSSRNGSVRSTPSKMETGIRPKQNLQPLIPNLQSNAVMRNVNTKKSKAKKQKKAKQYTPYLSKREVDEGLKEGLLIQGAIRINQKNSNEAYVGSREQSDNDYLLKNIPDRNRALEGDIVVIKLKPESDWHLKYKTATVVYILEKVHSRMAIGQLTTRDGLIILIPRDKRLPKMKIAPNNCPVLVVNRMDALVMAKILCWPDIDYAEGAVCEILGLIGDLSSENRAILAEYNVDVTPHPPSLLQCVTCPDLMSHHEQSLRQDFRGECIFTIDPSTARDLDDAVSCTELPNGNFRVGVHISDVAFYLIENTELDIFVRRRATSVYMVDNVYHMLPPELCMRCSLLPGVDKRAFSVVWEMTKTGTIVEEYFARTVINSCAQLAYEHAQLMIENPTRKFQEHELPQIHGGYTYVDLSHKINSLQQIALNLRRRRFDNGALRIDQTKLIFRLDESGEPAEFSVYENKEAHRLIEEFMLLANISVATKILHHIPDLAFLRRHDPPKESMLVDLTKRLEPYNIHLDTSSSKGLQTSVLNIGSMFGLPHMAVINHLLTKPMQRARYFCASTELGNYSHYALHIPIYTHFTSPIRRYADIMVHRLLAASLGYTPNPTWAVNGVAAVATHCNDQKYAAKSAGDASLDLYLAHYIQNHKPFIRSAIVFHVRERSFDALVPSTGSVIRIKEEGFEKGMWKYEATAENKCKVVITFPQTSEYGKEQVLIEMFQTITVVLDRIPNTNSLSATLLRPISSQLIRNKSAFKSK
uniref:RNB domain-containing protein n=3 Tax=Photinus pyralis TaxID=7054 RepID=A0A1Y1MUI4_PHOPY